VLHPVLRSLLRSAARLLAQAGAFLDAEDQRGCTPLWHAIDGNNEAVVRLLVESGADANSGLEKPLHLAAEWDCADVVDLLVGHGADVFALDAHGQTASDLAEQTQSLDALERLMSAKRRELARQSRESIQTALGLPDEHARQSRKM
jgi:ankyrin repeat protein